MKKYIGTKVIMAEPMTMTEAQKVLGRELKPAAVEEDGYLVEYKDGYKSWSPKSVFDEAYKCAETSLDRMEIEYVELMERANKCKDFLASGNVKELDRTSQALLSVQNELMDQYSFVLGDRMAIVRNIKPVLNTFTFGTAILFLKAGMAIRRVGWSGKGLFVVKQIPAHIEGDVIPKMQSLPQSAKDILMSRENPHIDYTNQMLIINPDGRADSWVPSSSDVFAEDWEVVTE